MSFELFEAELRGLKIINPEVFEDDKGLIAEIYKKTAFETAGIDVGFVHDNYSKSEVNASQGLHYQKDEVERAKIVQCSEGGITWNDPPLAIDCLTGDPILSEKGIHWPFGNAAKRDLVF